MIPSKILWRYYYQGKRIGDKGGKSWFTLELNGQLPQNKILLRTFWEGWSGRKFLST